MTTPPEISDYISSLFAVEDPELVGLRQASLDAGLPQIQISAEEGAFLAQLIRISGAKRCLEIGVLGGYSAAWIARALPSDGHLIGLEKSGHHAQVATTNLARLGLSHKVEIRQGEALDLLRGLASQSRFDFVFIDADKPGYPQYMEWAIEHVRPGGVITAHNTLWGGSVAKPEIKGEAVDLVRDFNRQAASDPRIACTIFPAGDGTLVAVVLP